MINDTNKGKERKHLENSKKSNPSPKRTGITNGAAKEINPNPSATGTRVDTHKEKIVDWVQRRFGAPIDAINVTTNYLCQEIPSQTMGSDPRATESTGATNDGYVLRSDEVVLMEEQCRANYADKVTSQRVNVQEKQADLSK